MNKSHRILAVVLLSLCFVPAAGAANDLTKSEKQAGFELLFNGKDLAGWDGDPRLWSVKDGVIVGSTDGNKIEHNSFLISKEKFSDFVLLIDIRLRNHNSGIQFRSEAQPDWVVGGYQADAAEDNWWGSIYGERTGRNVIANGWQGKGEKAVKHGDWNHYEITCKGNHITLKLNGTVTADIEDDMSSAGILALQLHAGPPMQASFRNIKIKKL